MSARKDEKKETFLCALFFFSGTKLIVSYPSHIILHCHNVFLYLWRDMFWFGALQTTNKKGIHSFHYSIEIHHFCAICLVQRWQIFFLSKYFYSIWIDKFSMKYFCKHIPFFLQTDFLYIWRLKVNNFLLRVTILWQMIGEIQVTGLNFDATHMLGK